MDLLSETKQPSGASRSLASLKTKTVMYGLPCAACRVYYSSELAACPVCNCAEQVLPDAGLRRAVRFTR